MIAAQSTLEPHGRWLEQAQHRFSAFHGPRPKTVSLLVIHNISLPPGLFGAPYIDQLFTGCVQPDFPILQQVQSLQVSAHLLIRRDGQIIQYVPFDRRAWHAGVSCFAGEDNCNDYSIGIEMEGTDTIPYSDRQYQQLAEVCRILVAYYPRLSDERIVGHCDIAPGRKTDPGAAFDWSRLRALIQEEQR
ncbi:1,6-anhydro-N-acetylmuramyl-L-alanine amidase AmpD [uncultured Ferrimonas sp.]|uniref:1,6-anhydro-N-acetylmuramyl-L-alanine amidase AmpD n=1 Tax=uncultured Ferrimonas sp. TaxID=432640 RepID=UPI00261AC45B|nr:1,6-anhydro-N-acetylmuramyl-L-alanine amidase AmpD [uncultured Ferrimonas sp.]